MLTCYIPTYGRLAAQATFDTLPRAWQEWTYLVASPEEAESLEMLGYPVLACPVQGPGEGHGISPTRGWILDQHDGDKLVMLDDDLRWGVRRRDDETKFRDAEYSDIDRMLSQMSLALDRAPVAGVSARGGANHWAGHRWRLNGRLMKVLALNVEVARREGFRPDRTPLMEDFDLVLQVLTAGYPTLTLNDVVTDDRGSNAPGGCSTYRDGEAQTEAAMWLADTWPGLVKLVERPPWPGMTGPRLDVRVAWKRAYEQGCWTRSEVLGQTPVPVPTWDKDGRLL